MSWPLVCYLCMKDGADDAEDYVLPVHKSCLAELYGQGQGKTEQEAQQQVRCAVLPDGHEQEEAHSEGGEEAP